MLKRWLSPFQIADQSQRPPLSVLPDVRFIFSGSHPIGRPSK